MIKKILIPSLLLGLAACSGNSGSGTYPFSSSQSFMEPSFNFTANKSSQDFLKLSSSEKRTMLQCDDPSMDRRTEKEKMSMSVQVVSRAKWTLDAPMTVTGATQTYTTDDSGATFSTTSSVDHYSIADKSIISDQGIAFADVCSRGKGCDEKKRHFTRGSSLALVRINKQAESVQKEKSKKAIPCNFRMEDNKPTVDITQGTVELGGNAHNAVSIVTTQEGSLYCASNLGSSNKIYMGAAVERSRIIVLADNIPNEYQQASPRILGMIMGSFRSDHSLPCSRTIVFSGSEITSKGTHISGESTEISAYTIDAETPTLEEWESSRQSQKDNMARLQKAVDSAEDDFRQAQSNLRNAKVLLSNRVTDHENKTIERGAVQTRIERLKSNDSSTEDQIKVAEKELQAAHLAEAEAKVRKETAANNVKQAEGAKDQAEKALFNAELELKNFKAEIARNN